MPLAYNGFVTFFETEKNPIDGTFTQGIVVILSHFMCLLSSKFAKYANITQKKSFEKIQYNIKNTDSALFSNPLKKVALEVTWKIPRFKNFCTQY